MLFLAIGLVLFLGVHVFPHFKNVRSTLIRRLGKLPYRGLFSLISLVGFGLVVWGKGAAPYVHVFSPPVWGRHATMSLMLVSTVLLASIYLPTNLKRWTAHPMMWATTVWAGAHLLANGDLSSLLLFGGFFVFGLFDIWSANLRGAEIQQAPVSKAADVRVLLVAVLLYGLFVFIHPYAFGVAVVRI